MGNLDDPRIYSVIYVLWPVSATACCSESNHWLSKLFVGTEDEKRRPTTTHHDFWVVFWSGPGWRPSRVKTVHPVGVSLVGVVPSGPESLVEPDTWDRRSSGVKGWFNRQFKRMEDREKDSPLFRLHDRLEGRDPGPLAPSLSTSRPTETLDYLPSPNRPRTMVRQFGSYPLSLSVWRGPRPLVIWDSSVTRRRRLRNTGRTMVGQGSRTAGRVVSHQGRRKWKDEGSPGVRQGKGHGGSESV